ncbi:MAG TPA: glycoside hydrolase family 3 N-terminal domain-containing protein, partial [Bryobacteraceae bacterium]|nr:glycoside hydrolase family 3 N-terminal domain-containing protein [Bryobacteraceae bacterium]
RSVAQRWMAGMKLRDLVGQLVIASSYGEAPPKRSRAYREYVHAVRDLRVGGLIVVNRVQNGSVQAAEPYQMATFLNQMQKLARVPLLIGGDFERGASMRVSGTVRYPHAMAYGAADDLELTRALGADTAREARALGVNWVFAPVADVNNNPDNPIINVRSFGEDPGRVAAHVRAFIEGAHSNPRTRVLVTAKHFPGHGDTTVDSHINLPQLLGDRARLDAVELVPFRAAIADGVDAVMTAHMAVPAVEQRAAPATVSEAVLTGLLRKELRYQGLIVTDAMDMQGLTKQFPAGEAAVRALEAGVDVLLMPPDPDAAVAAVMAAVKKGRLTVRRIHESAARVLAAKARIGLHRSRLVDLDAISDQLDDAAAAARAQRAAEAGVTLVRNTGNLVPVAEPDGACLFVLSESRYGQQGRALVAEARRIAPKLQAVLLDPAVPAGEMQEVLTRTSACRHAIVAAFVSVAAYRGDVALAANFTPLMAGLMTRGAPVTLVSLGSPYLLRSFPDVAAYMATFSTATTSEVAAARALFGRVPIRGKMPVSIPGLARPGDGIALPGTVEQTSAAR